MALIDSGGTIGVSDTAHPALNNGKLDHFLDLLKRNDVPAPTVLARREAWAHGLPIPNHLKFNDWYLSLCIAQRWPLFFINEVIADYRVHNNNMHTAIDSRPLGGAHHHGSA